MNKSIEIKKDKKSFRIYHINLQMVKYYKNIKHTIAFDCIISLWFVCT